MRLSACNAVVLPLLLCCPFRYGCCHGAGLYQGSCLQGHKRILLVHVYVYGMPCCAFVCQRWCCSALFQLAACLSVSLLPLLLQVRQFIDGAYQRTLTLMREKKDFVEAMAQVRRGFIWFRVLKVLIVEYLGVKHVR